MTDQPTQDIRIRIITERVQQASSDLEKVAQKASLIREQLNALKPTINNIDLLASALKRAEEAATVDKLTDKIKRLREEIAKIKKGDLSVIEGFSQKTAEQQAQYSVSKGPQQEISMRQSEISETRKELSAARVEMKLWGDASEFEVNRRKQLWKADAQAVRDSLKEQQQARKEILETERAAIKAESDARREYIAAQKNGYVGMSQAAQEYGKQIASIRQQIETIAKSTGQPFRVAAQQYAQQISAIQANVGQLANAMGVSWRQAAQVIQNSLAGIQQPAAQFSQQIQTIQQQLQQLAQATNAPIAQLSQQLVNTNGTMANVNTAVGGVTKSVMGLGQVAQYVFGTVFGLSVIGILRQTVTWLMAASKAGLELAKAFFQLEVGVRVLRRSGMDITFSEMTDNLEKLRQKYGVFTTKELVVGAAAFSNLIRDLGLTKDQFFELQEAVAQLAIINGRAMDDVQRTVALALSSGYTEGLQRLGVSINRVTIAARANAMGWKDGYNALTEYQRGQATLSLLLEKTGKYQDDLNKYLDTFPGRVDAATASIEENSDAIGYRLVPAQVLWMELLGRASGFILDLLKPMDAFYRILLLAADAIGIMTDALEEFGKARESGDWETFNKRMKELFDWDKSIGMFKNAWEDIKNIFSDKTAFDWGGQALPSDNPIEPFVQDVEGAADELAEKTKDMAEELIDLELDFKKRTEEIKKDYIRDLQEMGRQLVFDVSEVRLEQDDKIEEKQRDTADKIAKITRDYNQAMADAEYDYNKRREEIGANFREKSLQEELRYQEQMRNLQEDFYYDLDDALRSRDAWAIIRTIRKYRQDREQAKRQHEQTQAENKRNYDREIAEAQEVWRRKKEILARENADRLADLQETLDKELKEEKKSTEDRIKELQARAAFEASQRKIKKDQQLADAEADANDRRTRMIDEWAREAAITQEGVDAVIAILNEALGPGGRIDDIYNYFITKIGTMVGVLAQIGEIDFSKSLSGVDPSKFYDIPSADKGAPYRYQQPSNYRPNLPLLPAQQLPLPNGAGASQEVTINIGLSPELESQWINQAIGTVANVITRTQRASK